MASLLVLLLGVALLMVNPAIALAQGAASGSESVIVGFQPDTVSSCRDALVAKHGGVVLEKNTVLGFVVVGVDNPARFMERIAGEAGVRYAELNRTVHLLESAAYTPEDSQYSQQWALPAIKAELAWDIETGNKDITIAIVDTGIDYDHPDLGNYVAGGYNWVKDDVYPQDDHGHGTHCAGIAAATMDNGIGVAGIAQVNVTAEKVLGSDGKGTAADVAFGIANAVDSGADIISLSLGGDYYSPAVSEACQYAWDQGCLLVAAAGNDGESGVIYPAAYATVIGVGAIDQGSQRASFSNWGTHLELVAPGVSIVSTYPGGDYAIMSGTSMATPHVAGVAALVWSADPTLTNQQVRDLLTQTADDLGDAGWDEYYGYGRVDAQEAVSGVLPSITSVSPERGCQGETLDVIITGANYSGDPSVSLGLDITVNTVTVDSSTQITADITIGSGAGLGTRDVSVTTSAGTATLAGGFTVDGPNQPPHQPENTSPEDGAADVSLTPALECSPFSDPDVAESHTASHWQVSALSGDYSGPVFESISGSPDLTRITVPSGHLDGNTTYYWRVKHQDNHGDWSEWSEETSFTTLNRPPACPVNVSPADGEINVDPVCTLRCSAFSDPDTTDGHAASHWQVRSGTGDYSDPVLDRLAYDPDLTEVALSSGLLDYVTTYYWRVKHQDSQGAWSDWSEETSFTTLSRPPAIPTNLTPAEGDANVGLTPTLYSADFLDPDTGDAHAASWWQATADPGDYSSAVYDSGATASDLTDTAIPGNRLTFATIYFWRVRYQDSHGAWSDWSEETSFTTLSRPPAIPTNLTPAEGVTDVSLTPALHSSAFYDPDEADTHTASQWQITAVFGDYSDPVFDSDRDTGNLTSITVPSGELDYGTTYHWHVKYEDSHETWSEYSLGTAFVTATAYPDQPSNLVPADEAIDVELTPTLDCSAFSDPDSRDTHAASQWQITAVSGDYSDPVFDSDRDTSNLTSITLPSGKLDYGTGYCWRVRHQNSEGNWSPYSAETCFTVFQPEAPLAEFAADATSGTVPFTVQFTDQSTGDITTWEWDFDGDGKVDSSEQSPTFTYQTPGVYSVSLAVAGPGGCGTEAKDGYISVEEQKKAGLTDCACSTTGAEAAKGELLIGWTVVGLCCGTGYYLSRKAGCGRDRPG